MSDIIGRRYAKALVLSLTDGKDADGAKDQLAQVESELSALAKLMAEKGGDFRHAMLNPAFNNEARMAILDDIAKENSFSAASQVFIRLLVAKDRLPYLEAIAKSLRTEVDERLDRVRATIVSAKSLDDSGLNEITAALEKRTGKTVVPEVKVDENVISGVSAQIGGLVFDGTLRAQLDRLAQSMHA